MGSFLMLGGSVVAEVFADSMMKVCNERSQRRWLIGTGIGYLISILMMSQVLAVLPLGLTYAVWTSAGIILTALVGNVVWGERLNTIKVLGMLTIIMGIVVLRMAV